MTSRRLLSGSTFLFIVLLILLSGISATRKAAAYGYSRIISCPESPVFFIIKQDKYDKGTISKAILRTPHEKLRITGIEGTTPLGDDMTLLKDLDGDGVNDTVWKIILNDADNKGKILWTVTLSGSRMGWLFTTDYGRNRWEQIPFRIEIPQNLILHFSSSTPEYKGLNSLSGDDILTFVYVLSVTEEGPSLVLSPSMYDTIYRITSMIAAIETDEGHKFIYENMLGDYGKMSTGKLPSQEAVLNFKSEKLIAFEW